MVLSACNSGMGKIKSEGVIGLSRAFLAAGCQHSAPEGESVHKTVNLDPSGLFLSFVVQIVVQIIERPKTDVRLRLCGTLCLRAWIVVSDRSTEGYALYQETARIIQSDNLIFTPFPA